ncbi:MAG TPA: hypothetical protein VGD29_03985 [Actinoplanes sp.]|jgi:hypothetical protein
MAMRSWDGVIRRATVPGWATGARIDLALAAQAYDWWAVFDLIRQHPHFVNSSRPDEPSWFAPLHRAADSGVVPEIANRLIAAGAWRALRTSSGERPVDVARRRGHEHLLAALEPPRRIDVPADVLETLQKQFHELIRQRMQEFEIAHELRLPELEVMLELERPELWFPVPGMYGGFHLRLEPGARLLASSWSRIVSGSEEHHEITESGTRTVARRP